MKKAPALAHVFAGNPRVPLLSDSEPCLTAPVGDCTAIPRAAVPLTAADLSRIESLARAATPEETPSREEWRDYVDALDPDTVLALVEAARRDLARDPR